MEKKLGILILILVILFAVFMIIINETKIKPMKNEYCIKKGYDGFRTIKTAPETYKTVCYKTVDGFLEYSRELPKID